MSINEVKRRKVIRVVMLQAWKLKKGTAMYTMKFASSLKFAWKIIRSRIRLFGSKLAGVSFGNRQELLRRLLRYDRSQVVLKAVREPNNQYDTAAIAVVAYVRNKDCATIGFINSQLAKALAPILDSGGELIITDYDITGCHGRYHGCNIRYFIA